MSFVDELLSKANSMVTNEQFASKLKLIDTAKLYKVSIFNIILIYLMFFKLHSNFIIKLHICYLKVGYKLKIFVF